MFNNIKNKIEQTNLVDAMSNIPGIYNFSTGNGIAKPVIRGLSGMRVLTSQNGLRLENQQWGADHGFAVLNLGSLIIMASPVYVF